MNRRTNEPAPPPKGLGADGRALWKRIHQIADCEDGAEQVLLRLCRVADRLAEVAAILDRDGLVSSGGAGKLARKHPLVDLEVKLYGQFAALWRLAGLAREDVPAGLREPGRPRGS